MKAALYNLSDIGIPIFAKTNVLEKEVLNFASISANSNKFYIIELQEGYGDYKYCVYTERGRMGCKNPVKQCRFFQSYTQAYGHYQTTLSGKLSKGYVKIILEDSPFTVTTTKVIKNDVKEEVESITDKVLQLVGKLYSSVSEYLIKSIQTPLGKISPIQVSKALDVLNEIERSLDAGYTSRNEYLSDEFYSYVPVIFGRTVNRSQFLIDTYAKLNEKKELLDIMSSAVKAHDSFEKTVKEKYESLNIELKCLSKRTKEYKRLVENLDKTSGSNHHYGFKIKEIYEVKDMVGHKEFNPYNVEVMELFHGTRNENILSVMQSGLKIKPSSAIHTGSMFGRGIYFADCSTKSANYCCGYNNSSTGNLDTNYLFVCDVATGKIKEYNDAKVDLYKAPHGFNSVMGKRGKSLIHNEYIVYNTNQVKIKYIIEFKRI